MIKPLIKPFFNGPASFPTKNCQNNKLSRVKMGMPQKFQSSDDNTSFSNGRAIFLNAPFCSSYINGKYNSIRVDNNYQNKKIEDTNWSTSSFRVGNSRNIRKSLINGKSNQVVSSDQHIQKLKNKAIGRGTTNPNKNLFSFAENRATNITNRNSALNRVRNSGCVPPPKVGAVKSYIY